MHKIIRKGGKQINFLKLFFLLVIYFLPFSVIGQNEILDVGDRRQLFVDHYLIAGLEGNATLKLHKPKAQGIVMTHDEPWEGNTCAYHTIFKDGDIYRMYYRASNFEDGAQTHPQFACYAESKDGIHWEKPDLGLIEFNGSKSNNIIRKGKGAHNFTPFRDNNPEAAGNAKYKAVGGTGDEGLFAFQSGDGIHWEKMQDQPILTQGAFDSQNLVFWDSVRSEYRAYFRDFRDGIRGIKTATSTDFKNWSEPEWLKYPGTSHEHLYTNQILPYERAPHIFIGFPSRYLPDRESLVEGLFMSSRDGKTFHRWQEAIIRPGRNQNRWHNRSNYIWWGLVPTNSPLPGAGKDLSLYTNERYYMEKGVQIRRFTYRPDGFVSINANYDGGTVVTKPLKFSGDQLHINFATSAAGSVKIGILDKNGSPVEGFRVSDCREIYGDNLNRVVKWDGEGEISDLQEQEIRLKIILKDADVYSFKFGE